MSTYEPIASQTLGSAASSVTFSSIPQGYTDLVLVLNVKGSTANFPSLHKQVLVNLTTIALHIFKIIQIQQPIKLN